MGGALTRMLGRSAAASGGRTGTDPNWSSVKLLMGFEGTNGSTTFVDESGSPHTMTANGNAQITTAQFKYGTASGGFDGAASTYVSAADSADWAFGSGDFTIDMFVRHATSSTGSGYVDKYTTSGNRSFIFSRVGGQLGFTIYVSNSAKFFQAAVSPTVGQWYHYAVDRASGTTRIYVDGVMLVKSALLNGTIDTTTAPLKIGRDTPDNITLNGQLDEVRITKGVARYASDSGFTVPSSAYPGA